ncbi:prepilin peptidase [Bradyrhizobium sp. AUGA SZCCT0274]|uniref:prepilin peptidase n=1 Tax=Bradyrhizobium sp. AUGA SZCCT0274 TaxID=2807670 RepID=UPI001BA44ECF|nr:A24 family peptidase [Bradyrhizobium sp. AUGA SZCCT0274]MBR1241923.1 prepilin peptidase [Bradyrhizobium sp. AUGA SZCCT0274]
MTNGVPDLLIASKAAFGCLLFATVLVMAVVDCREMILPNRLNALLAGGGIGQAVLVGQPNLPDAVLGALLGFVVLSAIAAVFRRVRDIDGLGFGDQKFAAAAGIWIGWEQIATMLLIASCSALAFVILRSARRWNFDTAARVPFGPFLGLGTVACWLVAIVPGS